MNKLFKTIYDDIKKNKSLYVSLIIVVIISIIFGTLFITILSDTDKKLVANEISNFFSKILNDKYISSTNLLNNILNNSIYGFIIWILGISIIGIPIIICMLFYKGFTLIFTISTIIYKFKIKGVLMSFIYIFPHLIVNLIVYYILVYYSFILSSKIFKSIFNKEEFNVKNYIKKYIFILIISLILLVLTALYETYIMPYILKFVY